MIATAQKLSKSLTTRILAMMFAGEFLLIYPLYVIMFSDRGHVDAKGVGIILGVSFALVVLFEIPTGILADKIARKHVIIASILAKMFGLMIWLAMPYFWGYMLAAVLLSLGLALESGAIQAYLYGTLGDHHKERFGYFWGQVSAMLMIAYTAAYCLTAIVGVRYEVLLIASIASCVVALGFACSLPKDTLAIAPENDPKPKIFKTALKHIITTPSLSRFLWSTIIIVALSQVIIEYTQVYYKQVGIPLQYIAITLAAGNLTRVILFWTLHLWEKQFEKLKVAISVLVAVLFYLSTLGGTGLAVAGMILLACLVRVMQIQFETNIQHLANDTARATIASIASFGARLVGAVMLALVGAFAIDDVIVKPLRVALLTSLAIFISIQLVLRSQSNRQEKAA